MQPVNFKNFKRIKVNLKEPNPLFRKWLKEYIDESTKKRKKISKTYQKALSSLEKYPLTLYSGHDCAILEGFGTKICELLEERLQKHLANSNDSEMKNLCYKDKLALLQRREHAEWLEFIRDIEASHLLDDSLIEKTAKSMKNATHLDRIDEESDDGQNSNSFNEHCNNDESIVDYQEKDLVECITPTSSPGKQSQDEDSFDRLINKYCPKNVKEKAKPKTQLLIPEPTVLNSPVNENRKFKKFKSFTAVSNVAGPSYCSSPISKFLNVEHNVNPLKDEDEFDKIVNENLGNVLPSPILPKRRVPIKQKNDQIAPVSPIKIPTQVNNQEKQDNGFTYISVDDINTLEYDVLLIIDVGESKTSSNEIKSKLNENGVKNEVRKLHVGDFLWIAQHKTQKSKEYALPYIIERKRIDDLSSSIKDGRFHEQKFRLKQSGIENVIYLIENHSKGKTHTGLPFSTLLQAAANTQIHSKFQVKFTESCEHTGLYLSIMSSFIENIFKNKKPVKFKLISFETFNQSSVKQRKLTVRETFIKQLLTIKGLSVDIALEITKSYPTPTDLFNTFVNSSKEEGETLLSKITIGELKRKIPATISKSIYNYYMYK